jgi:hypothetical protein
MSNTPSEEIENFRDNLLLEVKTLLLVFDFDKLRVTEFYSYLIAFRQCNKFGFRPVKSKIIQFFALLRGTLPSQANNHNFRLAAYNYTPFPSRYFPCCVSRFFGLVRASFYYFCFPYHQPNIDRFIF